jgi:uncharacterized protein (DUF924 family)
MNAPHDPRIDEVLDFWVGLEGDPWAIPRERGALWFGKSAETDAEIERRFGGLVEAAASEALDAWNGSALGRLARVVLLDQMTRNIHRGTPRMYRDDPIALRLACEAIDSGHDAEVPPRMRIFFYLPLEHAEDLAQQERSVTLVRALAEAAPPEARETYEGFVRYAIAHRDVIAEHGRFPHRNAILGRASSVSEEAYLARPGAGF